MEVPPLYGRADQMLKLSPIHIKYLQEVLHSDAVNTIEEYAVWGGVPRYWELRLQNDGLQKSIAYDILNPLGTLYEEPIRLFMDDMRDVIQGCNSGIYFAFRDWKQRQSIVRNSGTFRKACHSFIRSVGEAAAIGFH